MLTGDEIRKARERAGITQAALGKLVAVSMRSIGNYERGETVPRNKMPRIEEVLSPYLDTGSDGPGLRGASDAELLAEIARRFERDGHGSPTTRAGASPAPQFSDEKDETAQRPPGDDPRPPDEPPEDQ